MVPRAGTPQISSPCGTFVPVFPGPLVFAPPQGISDGIWAGSGGPSLMIILFLLPSPFLRQLTAGFTSLSSVELILLLFLHGSLFVLFLFPDLVESGSGSLLLFLMGCDLKSYITH